MAPRRRGRRVVIAVQPLSQGDRGLLSGKQCLLIPRLFSTAAKGVLLIGASSCRQKPPVIDLSLAVIVRKTFWDFLPRCRMNQERWLLGTVRVEEVFSMDKLRSCRAPSNFAGDTYDYSRTNPNASTMLQMFQHSRIWIRDLFVGVVVMSFPTTNLSFPTSI